MMCFITTNVIIQEGKAGVNPFLRKMGTAIRVIFNLLINVKKQKNQPAWTGCLAPDVRLELTTT